MDLSFLGIQSSHLLNLKISQNLLALNPRVQTKGSLVPSIVTKENKKHWKRNADKSCQVEFGFRFIFGSRLTIHTNVWWKKNINQIDLRATKLSVINFFFAADVTHSRQHNQIICLQIIAENSKLLNVDAYNVDVVISHHLVLTSTQ